MGNLKLNTTLSQPLAVKGERVTLKAKSSPPEGLPSTEGPRRRPHYSDFNSRPPNGPGWQTSPIHIFFQEKKKESLALSLPPQSMK